LFTFCFFFNFYTILFHTYIFLIKKIFMCTYFADDSFTIIALIFDYIAYRQKYYFY